MEDSWDIGCDPFLLTGSLDFFKDGLSNWSLLCPRDVLKEFVIGYLDVLLPPPMVLVSNLERPETLFD